MKLGNVPATKSVSRNGLMYMYFANIEKKILFYVKFVYFHEKEIIFLSRTKLKRP